MRFDSAILLAVASVALLATTVRRHRWTAKWLGGLIVVLAAGMLAQQLAAGPLPPRRFLAWLYLGSLPRTAPPSPVVALAFALIGVSLAMHSKPLGVVRAVLMGLLGASVVALATVALFANTLALGESLPWLGAGSVMAVPTAVGLIAV